MGRKHLSGNTISMNNEVNLKGPGVRTWSTKGNSWPPLTVPTPDISSSFAGMLPSLMGALPVSSGKAGAGSSLAMAALGSVCASAGISLSSDPAGSGFLASYANVLQRVMSGAYAQAGTLDEEKLKKQIMALIAQMLEKAGPGFASWKQVLMDAMQNATLQDFMKGVQSAVCAMTGDPVNANTGNFVYEKDDLLVKGRIPLCFKRSYNCIDTRTGCMGEGWRHNYEIQLLIENNRYIILWEDGREELYLRDEDNTPEPLFGGFCRLRREGEGFLYETQDRKVYTFDGKGCLLKQEDLNGQGLSFMYDKQGRLSSVTNRCGSSLNYKYDSFSGMLMQVTDHTGRSVNLSYELGCLKEVKNAAGASYFYSYDADKNIFRISNPRGIYVLENSYDDQSRTIRQAFADSGEITYDYQKDLSRTLVTEQNGNKVVYVHDEKFRNIRTVYLDGEETFRYNDRNQLVTKKDKNGNITKISYDDKGNISQIIYPDGEKHNMTYDANNHLLILSVNGITKLKNTYDAKGNLIRTVDALGRCRAIEYDEPGNPVKLKEPDGSIISYTYDSRGNMNRITDGAGNCTVYEYDECNRVIRTLDGNGNRTNFSYDENNQITCVTNAAGKNRIYEYTKNGKLTKVIDFNGAVTVREYNNMNQVKSLNLPDGGTTRMEYDQMQNVIKRVLPNGAEVSYAYDSLCRLKEMTLPTGGTIRYEYNRNGNRTAVIDPYGNRTVMEYDERNRITKTTDPSGASTEYEYDMESHLLSVTNAAGKSKTYAYDEAGQLISETDVLGNTTCYEYNELGQLTCVIDPGKRKTVYEYAGGHRSRTIYPDGTYEAYSYDKNGNLTRRQNHKGDYLEITYDCLNQPIIVKSSFGQKICYNYDAVGNVTSVTDTLGNVTKYQYSLGGNLVAVIDAMGNKTEYGYDAMDNLITICQHEGSDTLLKCGDLHIDNKEYDSNKVHLTRYERNALGMIETITDPLGLMEHYTYNQTGQMIVKLDKEGYETCYNYTKTGELSEIRYADNRSVGFQYNTLKQLIEVKDWLGTTKVELDEAGRPRKITDYKGREIGYEWSNIGERTGIVYPDGRKVSYEYDELSRLSRLNYEGQDITYHYDKEGRLMEKCFLNGIITNYQYNSMGLLSCLTHKADGNILERYDYEYDLAGNKTEIIKQREIPLISNHLSEEICKNLKEKNGVYSYRYDKLDRLIEVNKERENKCRYEYDAFGNRIRKREGIVTSFYNYNAANQLLEVSGLEAERYQYDKRGNLTGILKEGKLDTGYQYDAANRLSRVVNAKGEMANYNYCGIGYRIGKQEYRIEKTSDWQEMGKEAEYDYETPVAQLDYLLDLTKPYHNLLSKAEATEQGVNTQEYIWDSNVVSMIEEKASYIYLQDELGSPVRILDMQENCRTLYGYDEFGQDLFGNQGEMQPFGYTGYQNDRVGNTYFAQAREYVPRLGRFAGKDLDLFIKFFNPSSLNQFIYCNCNPLKYFDPLGFESYVFYDPVNFEKQANSEANRLSRLYKDEVVKIPVSSKEEFKEEWNKIQSDNIDEISLMFHGQPYALIINEESNSVLTTNESGVTSKGTKAVAIQSLQKIGQIPNLNIMSCNTGHLDHENNVASVFLSTQNINEVYSWDGSIVYNKMMGIRNLGIGEYVPTLAMSQSYFESWVKGDGKKRKPIGRVVYYYNENGQIEVKSASPGDRIGVNYPINCESQN